MSGNRQVETDVYYIYDRKSLSRRNGRWGLFPRAEGQWFCLGAMLKGSFPSAPPDVPSGDKSWAESPSRERSRAIVFLSTHLRVDLDNAPAP